MHGHSVRSAIAAPLAAIVALQLAVIASAAATAATQAARDSAGAFAGGDASAVLVGVGLALACAVVTDALVVRGLARSRMRRVGAANAVTWVRSALVVGVVALVPPSLVAEPDRMPLPLVVLTAVALLLDGVDGRVARATGTASPFGARFDMEVDAWLVLVLSVAAVPRVGAWVLLVGLARYLLLGASAVVPLLARPTPPRLWRKVVAVVQGVVLAAVVSGALPEPVAVALAAAAALALAVSFGTQIAALLAHHELDAARG